MATYGGFFDGNTVVLAPYGMKWCKFSLVCPKLVLPHELASLSLITASVAISAHIDSTDYRSKVKSRAS